MTELGRHNARVVSQFSQQAEGYGRLTSATPAPDKRLSLQELLDPAPDDLLLDVCCGPGYMALDLAPCVRHVTGLDLTPAMIEQARAAQARRGIENADWVRGDVCALPFDDGAFSIVICGSAFHHLPEPESAFREMVRVCRAGGRVAVRDVTPASDKSEAYDRMEKLRDPSHVHALTREELGALGADMPLGQSSLTTHVTSDLKLDDVLATSFPETCTREDIRKLFVEDATMGRDRLGFSARLVDGDIRVSYRVSTAVWRKRDPARNG